MNIFGGWLGEFESALSSSFDMAIEEQKAEDLLGLENEDIEESTDEEGSEDDRRFSKRRVRQTQDLLAVARSSSNEDDESSDESDSDAGDEEDEDEEKKQQPTQKEEEDDLAEENHDGTEDEEDEEEGHDTKTTKAANEKQSQDTQSDKTTKDKKKKKNKKIKPLTPEEIEKFEKEQKRSGVCYLSSIPSYMSPSQLRQHLSKYAEIGRTYMVPQKGEKKKNKLQKFVEGWVEFKDKRKAKALAEYLNMRQVGGKRKNPFYFDTWNIKYLPKFKWHHLTEQMGKLQWGGRAERLDTHCYCSLWEESPSA